MNELCVDAEARHLRRLRRLRRRPLRAARLHISIPIEVPEILAELAVIKAQIGAVMATQEQVNVVVARIDTALTGIRADIEAIKAAHPDIDLSALESKVSDLEGLDAENPPPAPT